MNTVILWIQSGGVRSVLKDASDVLYVLKLEIPGTFKALSIYQDLCTEKCNVIPWINFYFDTLHVGKSIIQIVLRVGKKCSHDVDEDLSSGCCKRHQCQYLLKKII